jgi:hypothetical protein
MISGEPAPRGEKLKGTIWNYDLWGLNIAGREPL